MKDRFALKFACFYLNPNGMDVVVKDGDRFSLWDIYPERSKRSFPIRDDKDSKVVVVMKRYKKSGELTYTERVNIQEIQQFVMYASSNDHHVVYDLKLSIGAPERIHTLVILFLMRTISMVCENPRFFIPSPSHQKQLLFIVSNKEKCSPMDEERIKKRAIIIINYFQRELSKSDSVEEEESVREKYRYELTDIGMAPVSIKYLYVFIIYICYICL